MNSVVDIVSQMCVFFDSGEVSPFMQWDISPMHNSSFYSAPGVCHHYCSMTNSYRGGVFGRYNISAITTLGYTNMLLSQKAVMCRKNLISLRAFEHLQQAVSSQVVDQNSK